MAELPEGGWSFDYAVYERPRLGREVFRPVVPVSLGPRFRRGVVGLVDSGSEHTLASYELALDAGLDLGNGNHRLELGIGGRHVEAVFFDLDVRLHRDHEAAEYVSWRTEVGFVRPWDAEFLVIFGQVGFFDEFAVAMNRRLLVVHVDRPETLALVVGAMS